MAARMKYPIGIQSFPDVIEGGYVYVDKTMYIRELVTNIKYSFLSRPRRFGKSLFLSTLEAYFEGKRELFKGLDIDTDDMNWTPRPVIKFSFNTVRATEKEHLDIYLNITFSNYEKLYGLDSKEGDYSDRFVAVLKAAYEKTGQKSVVLVDEYDATLLSSLDNVEVNTYFRNILRSIFAVLKNADEYICFAFVTGVSRFSHTSLFSGANNLKDISFNTRFSAICGITEDELHDYFLPGIREYADSADISGSDVFALLKKNYDGYHFSKKLVDVYNPFSLLNALYDRDISNYWFQSGTPTYLLKVMKRNDFFLPELDCLESAQNDLSVKESYLANPVALLFESGYITIKSYDEEKNTYMLGLPNEEVAISFAKALLPYYSNQSEYECGNSFNKMRNAIIDGRPEDFMRHLQIFLQGNPYSNTELKKRETYFKNNIYLVCKALGFLPRVEEETCNARMDIMLRTRRYIYIFELKTDHTSEEGMRQIQDKGYALPYADEGRKIIKISANYSSKDNNLDSWVIE